MNYKMKNIWCADRFNVLIKYRSACCSMLKKESRRLTSGFFLSVLIHVGVSIALLHVAGKEISEEPPIRQIEFIDLTAVPEKPVEVKKERKFWQRSKQVEVKNEAPVVSTPVESETPKLALAMDSQKRFDMQRKQVPIKMDNKPACKISLNSSNDVLKISPAKGTRDDDRIHVPKKIDLQPERKIQLASTSTKGARFQPASTQPAWLSLNDSQKTDLNRTFESQPPQQQTVAPIAREKSFDLLKQTQTFISGQLANRQIISKKVPAFPVWAQRQGVGATISLRFTVMENGKIKENIIVERTSGSREWDRVVIEALRTWQFVALGNLDKRFDQTGVITFQFVI